MVASAARARTLQVAVPPTLDADDVRRTVEATVRQLGLVADVRSLLWSSGAEPVPEMLAAVAQQERRWQQIEAEYGLLGSADVARLAGSRSRNPAEYAAHLRATGQVIAVRRRGRYVYPGFQFDRRGAVRPVIAEIIAVLAGAGWDPESIALWMTSPNGYLGGLPATSLDQRDAVLDAATNAAHAGP